MVIGTIVMTGSYHYLVLAVSCLCCYYGYSIYSGYYGNYGCCGYSVNGNLKKIHNIFGIQLLMELLN